jgi:hypothetical protein
MVLRERLGGKWWWTLNIEGLGEGGVLLSLLGHTRWAYGAWRRFVVTLDLRCEMTLRLDFGMIFGVGI